MNDSIKTKQMVVTVQENGIIRNSKGRIIARFIDDIEFKGEHIVEQKVYNREEIFSKLPNREELKKMFTSSHYNHRIGHHNKINYKHVAGAEKLIEWIKENLK